MTAGKTRHYRDPIAGSLGDSIPALDATRLLADPTAPGVVAAVGEATRQPGFFCLDGVLSGSPALARLPGRMREFFELPPDDPRKQCIDVTGSANTNGWMPLYAEPAYLPGTLARVESFDCGRAQMAGEERSDRRNRWPPLAGFRDDVLTSWDDLTTLGRGAMTAIAASLGLAADFFAARCASDDLSTLRLLHYPGDAACPGDDADVGISAHTDFECITLIGQSAPGLELMDTRGRWYDVPAGPDRLVVLFGDMLERWTNGQVRATPHRVRRQNERRYSVVRFFAVDDGIEVSALPQFAAGRDAPRHAPTDQRTHTQRCLEIAMRNRDRRG